MIPIGWYHLLFFGVIIPLAAIRSKKRVGDRPLPTRRPGMALWRERLFAFLARNAQPATAFFGIPPTRVVEIGVQIEL